MAYVASSYVASSAIIAAADAFAIAGLLFLCRGPTRSQSQSVSGQAVVDGPVVQFSSFIALVPLRNFCRRWRPAGASFFIILRPLPHAVPPRNLLWRMFIQDFIQIEAIARGKMVDLKRYGNWLEGFLLFYFRVLLHICLHFVRVTLLYFPTQHLLNINNTQHSTHTMSPQSLNINKQY